MNICPNSVAQITGDVLVYLRNQINKLGVANAHVLELHTRGARVRNEAIHCAVVFSRFDFRTSPHEVYDLLIMLSSRKRSSSVKIVGHLSKFKKTACGIHIEALRSEASIHEESVREDSFAEGTKVAGIWEIKLRVCRNAIFESLVAKVYCNLGIIFSVRRLAACTNKL
jgi:hypothetical protein